MTLDEIEAEYVAAHAAGHDVARLHSGDLSVFSAVAEQIRRLERHAIPYTLTPGVPAFAAAAALLGRELTVPEIAQSVVLTRVPGRASAMPAGERLDAFAATGATLVLHLAIHAIDTVVAELTPRYGEDCPVAVVARATWPDERIVRGTLADIRAKLATEFDRAHRHHPGWSGIGGAGLPRKRALRPVLSPSLSGRGEAVSVRGTVP